MKNKDFKDLLLSIDQARQINKKESKMKVNNSYWRHFVECDCHSEGIMISCDDTDPFPNINLAIFSHGKYHNNSLSFKEKLRYCWNVIRKGRPFEDDIMLRQETAKELANILLEFSNKVYKSGDTNENNKTNNS